MSENDVVVPQSEAADAPSELTPPPSAPEELASATESAPAPQDGATADVSSIISLADIDASRPSLGEKVAEGFSSVAELVKGRVWVIGVVVAVLVLLFLFLPPVSLGSRLFAGGGYEALDVDTPALEHPDGLKVSVNETTDSKLRLKLSTVPQADFTLDAAPKDLTPAIEALPPHLVPKSPYYVIESKGNGRGPATMEIVIPNEAEPWETLDLYTWNGEAWQWLPTQLDRASELLLSHADELPPSVMVMQSALVQQRIVAETETVPPADAAAVLTEADLVGMLIGTMGGMTGDATQLPVASQGGALQLAPVIRNWVAGRDPNWALVSDMLNLEADRTAHIQNLLGLVQSGGYPGVVLDYRSVRTENREAFASFVRELSDVFQENGLWLGIVVEPPIQTAEGGWDTNGYDWAAIGAAADQLRVIMPMDAQAYQPGGAAEQLLEWTIARVNRYKVIPIFTTLSTDGTQALMLDDVLASLGDVQMAQPIAGSVMPGTPLSFSLGANAVIQTDAVTGASQFVAGDRVLWLGTPQWLRSRLDMVSRYHLGGVMLRNLLADGNFPNLIPAIADYRAQMPLAAYSMPEVTWEVTAPSGESTQARTSLSQPQFSWSAPEVTGAYRISASILGLDKGVVEVQVAEPAPVVEEESEDEESETDEEEAAASPDETAEDAGQLAAAFVTDVSVPDNTRFEKGESFTKTWRLQNAGDQDWPEGTVLVFASGEQMTDAAQVEVGAVGAGETVDISVDLVAPDSDGTFKGTWQLQANGQAVEGGGVFLVIKVGEEPEATGQPAAPVVAPVSGGSFELGGHVRDLGMPYSDKMHYAGMNWAKTQIHFGQDAVAMVNAAHSKGFKIQLSAIGSAGMVTEPGYEQKFADWLASLASSGADAIEVWNEPNIDREWQGEYISPQAYTNLLCTSYNAIKAANPGTAVISAAPSPTGWFGGAKTTSCGDNIGCGYDDQPWMEGLAAAGAASCMDYIGAHHNAGATSPSARSGHPTGSNHHSWYFLPQTELYYNIFGGARQIFYTEMGYASQEGLPQFSDQFAWARGINNAQQAAWLSEAASIGSSTGMVRCIIVWNIDFVRYGTDPQDGFAIIRPGGGCPACDALHNVLGTR